ncbi:MAG: hypothetical protein AAFY05_07905, partial [Pseudomonadota bacterium]
RESKHVLRSMSDLRGAGKDRLTSHAETLADDKTDCNCERLVHSICGKMWNSTPDDGLEIKKSDFYQFIS